MPASLAPRPPGPAEAAPSGPLAIVLSCPKCGAPFTADDAMVSVSCAHCGSLLVLSAPGRDEIYVADETTRGREDLRETVIRYRVQAEVAEIAARPRAGHRGRHAQGGVPLGPADARVPRVLAGARRGRRRPALGPRGRVVRFHRRPSRGGGDAVAPRAGHRRPAAIDGRVVSPGGHRRVAMPRLRPRGAPRGSRARVGVRQLPPRAGAA